MQKVKDHDFLMIFSKIAKNENVVPTSGESKKKQKKEVDDNPHILSGKAKALLNKA